MRELDTKAKWSFVVTLCLYQPTHISVCGGLKQVAWIGGALTMPCKYRTAGLGLQIGGYLTVRIRIEMLLTPATIVNC